MTLTTCARYSVNSGTGTTARVKRRPPPDTSDLLRTHFEPRQLVPAAPPLPDEPPGPFGNLSRSSTELVVDVVGEAWRRLSPNEVNDRRRGARFVLDHLSQFIGQTWQEHWEASGLNEPGRPIGDLAEASGLSGRTLQRGLRALFCIRVVRPSLAAFYTTRLIRYGANFQALQRDPLLDRCFAFIDASTKSHRDKRLAKADLAAALTVLGIGMKDLTPEALLYFSLESRFVPRSGGAPPPCYEFNGRQAWQFLVSMGHFASTAPATIREAVVRGQLTVPELVMRYGIRNDEVRDLLTDYLTRRAVDLDYSSLASLARILAGVFWAEIEQINPQQDDLKLDDAVYQQWKATISTRPDGKARMGRTKVLMAVRSLYLDLQSWAIAEPERWGRWSAPSPIRDSELRRAASDTRRARDRMAERTRDRQALLPILLDHVHERHEHFRGLLDKAAATAPGEAFIYGGTGYRRTDSSIDRLRAKHEGLRPVRVQDTTSAKTFNVAELEERAFWEWAIVNTLRHSGIRVEELCELTHLSVRQYQRPNGEVVALLVVAPSKSDRERVIPMSAELFATIAAIIRRHQQDQRGIPSIRRYDTHEKIWSDPLPFLFQRRHGSRRAVLSFETINRLLRVRCQDLASTHPSFARITFSAHDFRRLFATEVVNNGLPIHIGAALLGHLDTATTRGYVAVFDEDLIRHYQTYLARRRDLRPDNEYRPATDEEWTEFEEHFEKRRVELGNCARPYGTPCEHEHACIRCPMLHIDPKMLPRLDELERDLLARRQRAEHEDWLGEIEGIDLTLSFLGDKRIRARRLTHLGLPMPPQRS